MKSLTQSLLIFFMFVYLFSACGKDTEEDTQMLTSISSKFSKITVDGAMTVNKQSHEEVSDYTWSEEDVSTIVFNGTEITVGEANCLIDGKVIIINSPGSYRFTGMLTDGQIKVNTSTEGIVRLIFSGASIANSNGSALYVEQAQKVIIFCEDGSENFLSDSENYEFENAETSEPDATIFSKDDITICGKGKLTIDSNYKDAVKSKDGLLINDLDLIVQSIDDGVVGKDYLIMSDASLTITSGGDAIKSTNEDEVKRGYVYINNGEIIVQSGSDAIQAETDVLIKNCSAHLTAGSGSGHSVSGSASAKGIKAGSMLIVDGGEFLINTADDALHSNSYICINGGSFEITSADDGIHSDSITGITGGTISILKCYEGIESRQITIYGGEIDLISSDDGVNVVGLSENVGFGGAPMDENLGEINEDYFMYMHGGYLVINSGGDGLDSNGSILMDEGVLIIHGPTENMNGPIDYNYSYTINGGTLIAVGSAGMAQAPDETSLQYSVLLNFNSTKQAGNLVSIQTKGGEDIVCFAPAKQYQSFVYSSPALIKGLSCISYLGGSNSGSVLDGLYSDGIYTPGNQFSSFKISSITQVIN